VEEGDEENSHAWFTGFSVDADKGEDGDPDLCITVLIENGGVGSDKAVPIAKRILDSWYGEW
jgi:peptidoglycan glycosyltransferase